jgi:hypothetical protein
LGKARATGGATGVDDRVHGKGGGFLELGAPGFSFWLIGPMFRRVSRRSPGEFFGSNWRQPPAFGHRMAAQPSYSKCRRGGGDVSRRES